MLEASKAGVGRYQERLAKIDAELAKVLPADIAESVNIADHFDKTIFRVDKEIKGSLAKVAISPELTDEARKIIADEWQENARLKIKGCVKAQVQKMRAHIRANTLKGVRYEDSINAVRRSLGVSERRAKFIARQETSILMSKFKKARYTEAGSQEYNCRCTAIPIVRF